MNLEAAVFESVGLRVDTAAYRAELEGRVLSLEPKAFDLLVLLLANAGQLVTKQQILDTVWHGTAVTDNALTRVVAQLRKALGDDAREATYLETVPTRGYRWLAPVTRGRTPIGREPESGDGASQRIDTRRGSTRGRVAIGLLVLGALVVAAWIWSEAARRAGPRAIFPRQATLSGGLDVYPALSPDGTRIAYSSDRTGAWEIYVKPLGGGDAETALTADGHHNLHAAWSPDGRQIAFHSMRRGGIWVIPARGGDARQVSAFGARPTWAPDSRRIAFQSDPAPDIGPSARAANLPSTIWILDTAGGQPQPLTRRGIPIGGHGAPTWSPDGRRIAFATADFALSEIWAADVSGGAVQRLSGGAFPAFDPVYLPDGRGLVFGGGTTIWRVPLDAGGRPAGAPEAFTAAGLDNVRHFSVSRAGHIAGAALDLRTGLWSASVDADGRLTADPRPLTNDTRLRNSFPVFSPDGRRIAVMSSVAGRPPDIWVMNADGSGVAPLTDDRAFDATPSWMPDARHVTFKSMRDGRVGLWRVDVDTRREERLLDFGTFGEIVREHGFVQEAELSPDGARIAYARLDPQTSTKALYVRSLSGGDPVRITSGEPPVSYPAWSPDGKWIACELLDVEGTSAAVVPASGGAPFRLTAQRGHSWVHGWSPDSERVLFAGQRDGVWNVYFVPRGGGPERRVTDNTRVANFIRYPSWSPLGNQIVYEHGDVRGNVWLLDLP